MIVDRDLAELYGVETRRLNEQVKRNIERFLEEFMFQMTKDAIKQANIVTFLVAHKEFKKLDIKTDLDFCGVINTKESKNV